MLSLNNDNKNPGQETNLNTVIYNYNESSLIDDCGCIDTVGQHNDARMNLAIALTAVRHGAAVANHMEVLSLLKRKGKVKVTSDILKISAVKL